MACATHPASSSFTLLFLNAATCSSRDARSLAAIKEDSNSLRGFCCSGVFLEFIFRPPMELCYLLCVFRSQHEDVGQAPPCIDSGARRLGGHFLMMEAVDDVVACDPDGRDGTLCVFRHRLFVGNLFDLLKLRNTLCHSCPLSH